MSHADELLKEIQAIGFHRAFRGYSTSEVDVVLHRFTDALQKQAGQIREMEKTLARYREQEELLQGALLRAERNANLALLQAQSEARQIKSSAAEQAAGVIEEAVRQLENTENELSHYRRLYEVRLSNYEQEAKAMLNHFSVLYRRHVEAMSQEVSVEVRELVRRLGADLEVLPRPALKTPTLTLPEMDHPAAVPPLEVPLVSSTAGIPATSAEKPSMIIPMEAEVPSSRLSLTPEQPQADIPVEPQTAPTLPTRTWEEEERELLIGQALSKNLHDTKGRLVHPRGTVLTAAIIQDLIARDLYGEMIASLSA